ncbi:MAG TPA: cellulase family glycosylhydrolase, partial [Acidimicrobiales bacterium]|nr:cellulase family glycosylhydrolase [Acidimicrobiales bacterium]
MTAYATNAGSSSSSTRDWPTLSSRSVSPNVIGVSGLQGPLSAPGGPYLHDQLGRTVFLHGVNAVYKFPPYELFPDKGKAWNFDYSDAELMAKLGFNVVRLGMTWSGLEPGTAPANDPAICSSGLPSDPHQFNQTILDTYLQRLKQTVDELGRYHIYSLLDMHQDVYNEMFDGEGAPNWAVCTGNIPVGEAPGRWSNNYAMGAADAAYAHFWNNDVVGNLQGEFDRVWTAVASYFANDPWVVGYDPYNEPFSISLLNFKDEQFDSKLECFYVGKLLPRIPVAGQPVISCPPSDPNQGLIQQIEAADPNHLVFYEPDIYTRRGSTNFVGAMNLPRLVFNFHDYCSFRSGTTGNPTDLMACSNQEANTMSKRSEDRPELSSPAQPGGPAWFMSEFGATSNSMLLGQLAADADNYLLGWSYWSWKYYNDPTGSGDEALVNPSGKLRTTVTALSRAYPVAIAGVPTAMSSNATTSIFNLTYKPNHNIAA